MEVVETAYSAPMQFTSRQIFRLFAAVARIFHAPMETPTARRVPSRGVSGREIWWLAVVLACGVACSRGALSSDTEHTIFLKEGWRLQAGAQTSADGRELSSPAFDATSWHSATVPATVLSALVQDGVL